jgi:hypothetical protein
MVAGMAMAALSKRAPSNYGADPLQYCAARQLEVEGSAQGNLGKDIFLGFHLGLFTPLHIMRMTVASTLFGMIVWGAIPRRSAARRK